MKVFGFFQDDKGLFSSTRLMNFCLVMGYLAWATKIVWGGGSIPDVPLQFAGLVATLYGINKIGGPLAAGNDERQ